MYIGLVTVRVDIAVSADRGTADGDAAVQVIMGNAGSSICSSNCT